MTLFANKREANLSSTVAMTEDALIELGHIVADCRRDREGAIASWTCQKGSATIDIDLFEEGEAHHLRSQAVVMTLDAKVNELALFRRLLELNAKVAQGAAFALSEDRVLLTGTRSTVDLDPSETLELLTTVREVADEYDDRLVDEFGGTMGATGDAHS